MNVYMTYIMTIISLRLLIADKIEYIHAGQSNVYMYISWKKNCCILGHYIQTFVQISWFIENICKSEIFVRFPGAIQQAFIQQTGAAEYRRHVKPLAHM